MCRDVCNDAHNRLGILRFNFALDIAREKEEEKLYLASTLFMPRRKKTFAPFNSI